MSYNLQNITIGFVLFIFVIIFGASIIDTHVNVYDIDTSYTDGISNKYGIYQDNLSKYSSDIEDSEDDVVATEDDAEGLIGTYGTIKSIFGIRSNIEKTQKDVESRFDFLPKEVWVLISIILAVIFITVIAGVVWRYKEGLQ